jgi:hypothetical protein
MPENSLVESSTKIIFLNYTIKKEANGNKRIRFLNKIVSEGKLKNHHTLNEEETTIGDLEWQQIDKNSNILESHFIKNPLIKTIEFINDSKNLQTKTIILDSATFSIRLQLKPNSQYIRIIEVKDNQKSKPLIKTAINQ